MITDKAIIDPAIQVATKDLNNDVQINIIQLKNSAKKFLNGVQQVINNYNHEKVLLKRDSINGIKNSLHTIYKTMESDNKITQRCIELQYEFEQDLNKFLNRKILLLYVAQNGDMLYGDEVSSAQIYKTATATSGGKGSINNIQNQLTNFPKDIVQSFYEQYENRKSKYKPIYDKVIDRWLDNHDPNKSGYYDFWAVDKKKKDTFYWLKNENAESLQDKWDWSKVINRGHVAETYAYLIWQDKEYQNFDPNYESHIQAYWNYMEAHNILNSVSGIVQGDILFFMNEFLNTSIQFAVKSGKFNTAAIGSYLNVAYQLYYGTLNITKEMVESLLKNLPSYSYRLREYGLKVAEAELKKIIEQQLTK